MRSLLKSLLVPCLAAGLVACGDSTPTGGNDMAVPPSDGGGGDIAMGPDQAQSPIKGTVFVVDVAGKVPVPAGDAGVVQVPANLLIGTASFNRGSSNDYDDRNALGVGCNANHYSASHLPTPDVDVGTVKISGYTGALVLGTANMAPSEIDCALSSGAYHCTYGAGGPATDATPLASDPIMDSDMIHYVVTGNGGFSPVDHSLAVGGKLTVSTDLTMIAVKGGQDITINYSCPEGSCGASAVAVNLIATPNAPGSGTPNATEGSLTCAAFPASGTVTVKKEALAAMLGGATPDDTLHYLQVIVVRTALPFTVGPDAAGNTTALVIGRGAFATTSVH